MCKEYQGEYTCDIRITGLRQLIIGRILVPEIWGAHMFLVLEEEEGGGVVQGLGGLYSKFCSSIR